MASLEELDWWNKFADVMAEHWMLTPRINSTIREGYENDYEKYLFKANGSLLEVGCGTGWIGRKFAKKGMQVDGIDFSDSQLEIARHRAVEDHLANAAYFVRDLVNDSLSGRFESYDSVLVNAVLHHLSPSEIEILLKRIALVMKPGGRLYIYEPLNPQRDSTFHRLLAYPIDFVARGMLFGVNKAARLFRLFKANFLDAMQQGYTGTSPDEKPILADILRQSLAKEHLRITEETPFHNYSLAMAMSIVRLKPWLVTVLTPVVRLFYLLDQILFKVVGWQNLGENRSVMCGIKVARPMTTSNN